jgi:hypothetical protein
MTLAFGVLLAGSDVVHAAPTKLPATPQPTRKLLPKKVVDLPGVDLQLPGRIQRAGVGRLDVDSILGQALRAETPRATGDLAPSSLGSRTVEVAPGKTATLAAISSGWFADHDRLRADLRGAKGMIVGAVRDEVEVYELQHSYIMVRSTGATVSDPNKLRKSSPLFASLTKKRTTNIRMGQLSAASKKGLAAFKATLASRPFDDPLRQAMNRGDQALLNALADGVGEMTVIDTLVIPKRAPRLDPDGQVRAPKLDGGRFDYGDLRTVDSGRVRPSQLEAPALTDAGRETLQKALKIDRRGHTVSGSTGSTAAFVAGHTWADSWGWERTFDVPSGFLRVKLGAHYGLGLRIPIEVKTRMDPTYVCENGPDHEAHRHRFRLEAKATAIDGDSSFYERAGMPEAMILGGKELALEAGVGYAVKLRLFWETIVDKPYREHGFDWGRDFDPPQGGGDNTRVVDYFLPYSVTRSGLNFGPLHGSARIGFRVDVRGEAKAHITGFQGDQLRQAITRPAGSIAVTGDDPRASPQQMVFADTQWKTWEFHLLNHAYAKGKSTPSYTEKFGTMIDEVEYDSAWSVVPGVKVKAEASYHGYGIGGTWTFWVDSARLPIGSLDLPRHKRTRQALRNDRGTKIWHLNGIGDTNYCNAQ